MKPNLVRNAVCGPRATGLIAIVVICALAQGAMAQAALPTGGSVTAGSATISSAGASMTVNQTTPRAVIDWASFNIGSGASVAFTQPGTTSVAVNRVGAGGGQSVIDGALSANGHVMILNPDGIAFTSSAAVNVGGLIASTGNIDVAAFMASPGAPIGITGATAGSVVNDGSITVTDAGLVALVAPSVANHGTIAAASGRVALAGAQTATVSLNGGLYEIAVDQAATNGSVANSGTLLAPDGSILLSAEDASSLVSGVVNLSGVQQATHIEVRGNVVVLAGDLDAATVTGNSSTIEVRSGAQIQDAIAIAKTGTPGAGATVDVQAGSYAEQVTVNKSNLTLTGESGARILVPDGPSVDGVTIANNTGNVTVSGFEIAGPVDSSYLTYPWGANVSRGIVVRRGATAFALANNNIHDIRTGILIDGRDSAGTGTVTGSVTSNTIENTKSAISVQYTDGSGITMAGNGEGPVGNEWGINLHLNGFLDGGTLYSNPHVAAPSPTWQQSLLDLSAANGGWTAQDQGYSSANRTQVQVATTGLAGNQGSPLKPLDTIANGINAVVAGGSVNLAAGTYAQTSTLGVHKSVTLTGAGETQTTIDARGVTGYGISVSADDVTLSDLTVYGPSAYFASAYGIKVSPGGAPASRLHNFTIRNVTSRGAGKAELDLNGVDGATIDHVTADGAPVGDDGGTTQGAGIQLTDSANITVTGSTTRHNAWGGIAIYQANRSYDQRANNITIAANNALGETNPLYLQDESAMWDFGALSLPGFGYAVRNAATADSAQYTWMQETTQGAVDFAVNLGGPGSSTVQGWSGTAPTQDYLVGVGNLAGGGTRAMSIQAAIDTAAAGGTVSVGPGEYTEIAANRSIGIPGTYTLGLLADKDGLTIRGVNADGSAVDSADGVQAWVTAGASTNFGMNHGIVADNVTIEGLGFKPYAPVPNKTIEIAGDNFTFRNSVVDNRAAAGGAGALYFGELIDGHDIARLTVRDSKFLDGSVSVQNGVGVAADGVSYQPSADRTISGNTFTGSGNYRFGGLLLTGKMNEVPWRPLPIGSVVATGNSFGAFDDSVLVRGDQQGVDLGQVMNNNSFDRAVLVTDAGGNVRAGQYLSLNDVTRDKYSIQSSIQAGIDRAAAGDTVTVGAGTYPEQISISKSVALVGAGADQTVIAPSVLAPANYTSPDGPVAMSNILTIEGGTATSVEVSGLTLRGPVPGITSGIFVRDGAYAWVHDTRLIDMRESATLSGNQRGLGILVGRAYVSATGQALIENNEITGYQKGGIVVDGPGSQATISGNTITGEGPAGVIAQNGIQVSRGANATLAANTVSGNVYTGSHADPDDFAAGILFFASDPYVGAGRIAVDSSNSVTGNEFGIWTNDAGVLATIDLAGARANTRNAVAYTAGGYAGLGPLLEYPAWSASTTARVDAAAFGGSQPGDILDVGGTPLVSGWSGFSAIQPAIDAVASGGTVDVAAGSFAENVTVSGLRNLSFAGTTLGGLTLGAGAGGSGISGSVSANTAAGIRLEAPVVLLGDTALGTSGGPVSTAAIDGTSAGAQALTINAGSGAVTLGALGSSTSLGATVVTGGNVELSAPLLASSLSGGSGIVNVQAGARIQDGIDMTGTGGTVNVAAGTFAENVTVSGLRNLSFAGTTVGGLTLGAGAGGSGIGGSVSANTPAGIRLDAPVVLLGDATLGTNGGVVSAAAIDGTTAGAQALTIDAGSGAVTLGDLGAGTRLGAAAVTGTITFSGSNYNAESLQFNGPMTLTQASTTLSTSGGSIVLNGDIQAAAGGSRALLVLAGPDGGRGDVTMLSGGTQANPLGTFDVAANDFTLTGTLWVEGYRIDGLGSVALSGHTLNAQDPGASNTINAVGNVTGSTTSAGSVQVSSSGDVSASVTAQGPASISGVNVAGSVAGNDVTVAAQSSVSTSVTAQNNASVNGANVSGNISGSNVTVTAQNSASASVNAQSSASVTGANVSGNISGSDVTVNAQGDASATVTAQNSASVNGANVSGNISGSSVTVAAQNSASASVTAQNSASVTGANVSGNISGSSVTVAAQDANVSVTAVSALIRATNTVQATVTAGSAQVQAGASATISGSSPTLVVEAPAASVSGSFDEVSNAGTGLIEVNGRPQVNTTVASNVDNVGKVIPSEATIVGNLVGTVARRPSTVPTRQLTTPEEIPILRAPPTLVGEHIADGWAVEVDLSPRLDESRE